MHPFKAAVEAGDHEGVQRLLAEDVSFLSPVAFAPYTGRDLVAAILRGAGRAFEDFRYEREFTSADGRDVALVFKARIGDREVHGCDFLHLDKDGLIDELCVMVRPLSAAHAVSEAMKVQFETVQRELGTAAR
jgi:SnoaL-like domain